MSVVVVVDLIHVLEYLWGAVWCFFAEADPAAEGWVRDRAMAVLEGKARDVAAGIRRRATTAGLATQKRKKADDAARYLTNKAPYLDYPTALAAGWPIATGVIEGAVRHVMKDRMDITGARWSVAGAEAVLKLRAVRCNGDFDAYWRWHLAQERHRVHESRYADGLSPQLRSPCRGAAPIPFRTDRPLGRSIERYDRGGYLGRLRLRRLRTRREVVHGGGRGAVDLLGRHEHRRLDGGHAARPDRQ
ncbi:MAG: hypothetical protein ACRD0N_08970 [Acidimicrobiales bacterium]